MAPRNRFMEELAMPISIKGYISLMSTTPSAARPQARTTAPQAGGVNCG